MEEGENNSGNNRIGEAQFYNLITSGEVSWQSIIYDLIKTEQLDPWDINIAVLADKYSEVVRNMDDADFVVSSKVLHACAILLRYKAEILSNRYLQELDEAIYGTQEEKKYVLERISIDEDELPILVPKTPMARYKRVTLNELMAALHKAVETENRRIKKDIKVRQAERAALVVLPKANRVPLKDRVSILFGKIKSLFVATGSKNVGYSVVAPTKEEILNSFLPMLHLSNNGQIYLRQPNHFQEVFIHLDKIQEEIDEINKELELISPEDEEIVEEFEEENFEEELKEAFKKKKMKEIDEEINKLE